VTVWTFVLLVLAGIGAGLTGSIAGIASLVSYPALLAAGLAPVAANVTNTVALIFQGIGSIHGSRPELAGQRALIQRLALFCVLGGVLGAGLLLVTPSDAFAKIVPWLIAGSSVAVLLPQRPPREPTGRRWEALPLQAGVFVIGAYGGYFGAAAGVLMLALLLGLTGLDLRHSSALRQVLLFGANAIAALYFILFGPVHWLYAIPLALGLLVGGRAGPVVVRHAPTGPLKILIALTGLGLAIHLALQAY
jgi:uncharacterized membrane protein YfcA